jgi:hypothetical protein
MKQSVHLFVLLTIGLMAGCGSSGGHSMSANQTSNSTDGDSLGKEIVGSWNANYDDDLCNYNTFFSFSDDGTFSLGDFRTCADAENDYSYNGSGTWDIIDGVLYTTLTESSDGSVGDWVIYTFITSSQQMAMAPHEWLFSRSGSGSGFADTWVTADSDCTDTFVFNTNGTWTSDVICENPEDESHYSGTYTAKSGVLTLMTDSATMNLSYKLFGDSTLAICENDKLFTRE